MRITVLTYCDSDRDVAARRHDKVVAQAADALRENGHTVTVLGVHADLRQMIRGLERQKPDLVFNLAEMFGDDVTADVAVIGVLELMGLAYTGCSAAEAILTQDKVLGKKLLAFANVPYPRFAIFSKTHNFETGGNLRLPLFVKPARMDASIGIDKGALVSDANSLMRRVLAIHEQCDDDALAEEYIAGREFYVGVLGSADGEPRALPPIEMDFSGMPAGMPHVMDASAKFDESSAAYKGTHARIAEVSDELRARLHRTSVDAYRALRVRDYGRVDLRMNAMGELYVLEVNAACYLERSAELATAAAADGISYPELLQMIVESALARRPGTARTRTRNPAPTTGKRPRARRTPPRSSRRTA